VFIVPVNSWKFGVSSELLYKNNRPQVFMVYKLINHFGCWKNTRRIRKSLAYGSRFKSSSRNISKTSASVSSGFPNTRKLMKARGHRPSAFIVFECLETPMKHEARVFEIASQTSRVVYSAQKPKNTCGLLLKYPKTIYISRYISVSASRDRYRPSYSYAPV